MGKKQYSVGLPPSLAETIENHIEQKRKQGEDTSQADALRHYIRKGVEHREQQSEETGIDPSDFALDTARIILAGAIIVAVAGLTSGMLGVTDVVLTAGTLALIGSFVVVVVNRSRLPTPRVADDASSPGGVKHEH